MDKKATISSGIATLVLFSAVLMGAMAENFDVGGQKEWIVPFGGLNYTEWAQNITAHVGDSLYFKYNPNSHDVLKVDALTYASCNISAPLLQTWDTGDTTVMLNETGTHYFICGAPNHCLMGQAFALEVSPVGSDVTPSGPNILSPPGSLNGAPLCSRPHAWLTIILSVVISLYSSS